MSAVLSATDFIPQRTAQAALAATGPATSGLPVVPVLGQVDAACAALVHAVREAGLQPVLCASPGQALARAHAEGCPLVLVQAAAMQAAPGAVVTSLRAGGPLRLVLSGPEFGSLTHTLALEVGFDEVWPQGLPAPLLSMLLRKALGMHGHSAGRTPSLPPRAAAGPAQIDTTAVAPTHAQALAPTLALEVDAAHGICHWQGRAAAMTRGSALVLRALQQAYPRSVSRLALAAALDDLPGTEAWAPNEPRALGRRIDTQVSRLRQELAKAGFAALHIRSARYIGYRLELFGHAG